MNIKEKIKEGLSGKLLEWQERSPKRIYLSLKKEDIFETAKFLFKELGLRFSIASATDMPEGIEILYHFSNDPNGEIYSLRVLITDKKHPEINSLSSLFCGAEWIEREIWEMLGVNFKGHANLKRLLLAEDWPENNYPLRNSS
jgi:NADH:ubiquinone oxidoreductase subunit C